MPVTLEVVCYNIESALKAQSGGADRIELCADPGSGGVTPSYGTIEVVRQNVTLDLFVMVRPRGGDFVYSSWEFHSMKRDITQIQRLSADGVVLGILTPDRRIDVKRCRELIERARPMKITCHRAFDLTRDPLEALEDCIAAGFDRILTSGQKARAKDGLGLISRLNEIAHGRIVIMPGSGIDEHCAGEIIRHSGVRELHFSAGTWRNGALGVMEDFPLMGSDKDHPYDVRTVDTAKIAAIRVSAEAAAHAGDQ